MNSSPLRVLISNVLLQGLLSGSSRLQSHLVARRDDYVPPVKIPAGNA